MPHSNLIGRAGLRALALFAAGAAVLGALWHGPSSLLGGRAVAQEEMMAPELWPNEGWLNTDRPLRFDGELRGQVVLLDFWTYCCINCMHVAAELEQLEEMFREEPFIVIGVHSAKFEQERDPANVRAAIQRFGMKHPVVVDSGMAIWRRYGVRAWPTLVLIRPDGRIVGGVSGEGNSDVLEKAIRGVLEESRADGTLADAPLDIRFDGSVPSASGLAFPGKVLGDAEGRRLFIADSGHNRIVQASWPDADGRAEVLRIFGDVEAGFEDGPAGRARFFEPQGMALSGDGATLYVADRRNHSIRAVDLESGVVSTLVGTGEQSRERVGGKRGAEQGLNSPWALELDGGTMYVAMAGAHQIWTVDLATREARALVGSGYESLIDDAFADAALAQPSGLELVGDTLYFADSEVSAIRAARLDEKRVETVIGLGLFEFGDVDGAYPRALLQHCLGVVAFGEALLVADTYNDKIKLVDPRSRTSETWLSAEGGGPEMHEPGGISLSGGALFIADTNSSRILMVDAETKRWREVMLSGLRGEDEPQPFDSEGRAEARIRAGQITVVVEPDLPEGAYLAEGAPASIVVRRGDGAVLAQRTLASPSLPLRAEVDPGGAEALVVEVRLAYCIDGGGDGAGGGAAVCIPWSGRWGVGLEAGDGGSGEIRLTSGF